MEMVSQPDLRGPAEARAYLIKLRAILRTLGVSDADMEKGQLRCDVNVSLRPARPDRARHQGRDQELELVPRGAAGARVRDRASGGGAGQRRAHRRRRPAAGRKTAASPFRSAPRKKRTTIATSLSRTCRRCSSHATGSRSCGRACPSYRMRAEPATRRASGSAPYDAEQLVGRTGHGAPTSRPRSRPAPTPRRPPTGFRTTSPGCAPSRARTVDWRPASLPS